MKTAVFVDFDSIYRALGEWTFALTDRDGNTANAARVFATHPERWLAWIERGMPSLRSGARLEQQRRRSLLLRRCYLNPHFAAGRRSSFVDAAFSVIDCPFTACGRNSADIQMVIDILDALGHKMYDMSPENEQTVT